MNTAKTIKAINLLEDLFDLKSFDPISFASDLSMYPEEFKVILFEVVLNYIREIAERHPRDVYSPEMRNCRDIAIRLVRAMPQ